MADFAPKKAKREKKAFSGRGYPVQTPAGERSFPSVTTILDVVSKPALVPWAVKKEREFLIGVAADLWSSGEPFASREKFIAALMAKLSLEGQHKKAASEAADIGSVVHSAIENNLREQLGLPRRPLKKYELNDVQKAAVRQAYASFKEWKLKTKFHPLEIEKKLYSLEDEVAGTMDTLGEGNFVNPFIYSDLAVGDWKTSTAIYLTACAQIAMYRKMYIEMGLHVLAPPEGETEPIPSTRKLNGLVVRLPKVETDPDFEARFIPEEEMVTYYQRVFLPAKAIFWSVQEYERKYPWRKKKPAKEAA